MVIGNFTLFQFGSDAINRKELTMELYQGNDVRNDLPHRASQ